MIRYYSSPGNLTPPWHTNIIAKIFDTIDQMLLGSSAEWILEMKTQILISNIRPKSRQKHITVLMCDGSVLLWKYLTVILVSAIIVIGPTCRRTPAAPAKTRTMSTLIPMLSSPKHLMRTKHMMKRTPGASSDKYASGSVKDKKLTLVSLLTK